MVYVNNTVAEAKQNMDKEVQTVNEEVTQQVSTENSILAYQFARTFPFSSFPSSFYSGINFSVQLEYIGPTAITTANIIIVTIC